MNKWMQREGVRMIPASPETLHARLKELLDKPEWIPVAGRAARRYVEKRHDVRFVVDMLLADLYGRPRPTVNQWVTA